MKNYMFDFIIKLRFKGNCIITYSIRSINIKSQQIYILSEGNLKLFFFSGLYQKWSEWDQFDYSSVCRDIGL